MRISKTQRSIRTRRSKKLGSRRSRAPSRATNNSSTLRSCDYVNGGEKLSEKLKALKSLLPPSTTTTTTEEEEEEKCDGGETEELFQETADYIVRLRNQVVVLQKLIKIYGSSSSSCDQAEDFVL
ncbi:unnamed protein product [Cochlearia groenlandica]